MNDPVVIVAAVRTPIGGFQGVLAPLTAPQLGSHVIRALMQRSGLAYDQIEEVIMGCVLPAGLGQAPARQAALQAGLAQSTPCVTINKVCGSGMKAVMSLHDSLVAGSVDIGIAGGMESMSNAPYLLPKARSGYRLGHGQLIDHMFFDGLEDAYDDANRGRLMGTFAEDCANSYNFSRTAQDAFALESLRRAKHANESGLFAWELEAITLTGKQGETQITQDEQPFNARPEKIPQLKPAFSKDGTVTAANSSSISDGAAALLLMRRSHAQKLNLTPLATIIAHATHAQNPALFTTAPIGAIQKVLHKAQWQAHEVDAYEINEAFAVVAMAAMEELKLPHEKVNIHGGACALGHPIGASGARLLVTLMGILRTNSTKRGVASLCIGGGEATAIAIELCTN